MVAIASQCLQEDQPAILYSAARGVGQIFFDFPSDEDDVDDTRYFYGFRSHLPINFM